MDTHYEPINWGLGEIHFFRRAEGELAEALGERAAAQTAAWRAGSSASSASAPGSTASASAAATSRCVPYLNGSRGLRPRSPSGEPASPPGWRARTSAPRVAQTASEAAALPSGAAGGMGQVAELVAKGLFKREYRDHRLEWMIRSGGLAVVLEGLERGNIRFTPEFG